MGTRINLDHLTTTPVHPDVRLAMQPFMGESCGSPASFHRSGLQAREALTRARTQAAEWLGAESPDSITFTASATEAANLAIKGLAWAGHRRGNHIVLSNLEHPAVDRSVAFLEKHGFVATRVPVDQQGFLDPEAVRSALRPDTFLVCIHQANPDLGTCQDLQPLGELLAERGIPLFLDASSSAGWVPLDVQQLPASLVALAPHRFYGPKGVGILYRRRGVRLESLVHGGVQENGLRAGTENVPAIVGAGAAAALAEREGESRRARAALLTRRLLEELSAAVPLLRLNGPPLGAQRLPHHLNLSVEFVEGEALTLALDLQGVAIHSGPACLAGSQRIPPALTAVGLSPALARASVLLSPGTETTEGEVTEAVRRLTGVAAKLRDLAPLWEAYQHGRLKSEITGRVK